MLQSGLWGQYYNNMTLSGTPVLTRTDANIQFSWKQGSPDPAILVDAFSIRWSGKLTAANSETYTIYSSSDDGVRVWIDGGLIIDSWVKQSGQERKGSVNLIAGKLHEVKVEYYENEGTRGLYCNGKALASQRGLFQQVRSIFHKKYLL